MTTALDRRVEGVRRFNRLYTQRLGVLTDNYLHSPYTLAETRVLWELAQRETTSPGDVAAACNIDPGYLTRIVRRFEEHGLVTRAAAPGDRRRIALALTEAGRAAFRPIDERQHEELVALLAALPAEQQERVVAALGTVADALAPQPAAEIRLREPEAGDYGWIVERHGALYGAEYGFDRHFERDVCGMVAAFLATFDPHWERCWIAERDGVRCGSVLVARENETTARLRLLLIEPGVRGAGLGKRLVRTCVDFARAKGYAKMVLWTHANLTAARAIYAQEGFVMIDAAPNDRWGPSLISETWELEL